MKFIYTILISLLFSSCYVYQANNFEDAEKIPDVVQQIQKDQLYKLNVNDKIYTVKAVQWEGDSLVTYVNFKEKNLQKFHKNDIKEVKHRVFSRGLSDALTFGIYGGAITLLILLTK